MKRRTVEEIMVRREKDLYELGVERGKKQEDKLMAKYLGDSFDRGRKFQLNEVIKFIEQYKQEDENPVGTIMSSLRRWK